MSSLPSRRGAAEPDGQAEVAFLCDSADAQMRWSQDFEANALYVEPRDAPIDHQVEMSDVVVVDVDADGRAVGVEIVGPQEPWDVGALVRRFDLSDYEDGLLKLLREQSARLMTPEVAEARRGQHDLMPGLDTAGLPNTGSTNVAFVLLPAA